MAYHFTVIDLFDISLSIIIKQNSVLTNCYGVFVAMVRWSVSV